MESTEDEVASEVIPIASLDQSHSIPKERSIRAIVSLIWPYSSSTQTAAFLLADPDFRKRNKKGQVRVQLRGPAARAVAQSGVSIGDPVYLSLQGSRWAQNSPAVKTPGRSVEGELLFESRIRFQVERPDAEPLVIDVDKSEAPTRARTPPVADIPTVAAPLLERTPLVSNTTNEWASPLQFQGRLGSTPYDPFDDDAETERASKRSKFSVSKWRYDRGLPSPPKVGRSSPQFVGTLELDEESISTMRTPTLSQIEVSQEPVLRSSPLQSRQDKIFPFPVDEDGMEEDSTVSENPDLMPVATSPEPRRALMGPPYLPSIRTDLQASTDMVSTGPGARFVPPASPEIRPIDSAVLPAVSPLISRQQSPNLREQAPYATDVVSDQPSEQRLSGAEVGVVQNDILPSQRIQRDSEKAQTSKSSFEKEAIVIDLSSEDEQDSEPDRNNKSASLKSRPTDAASIVVPNQVKPIGSFQSKEVDESGDQTDHIIKEPNTPYTQLTRTAGDQRDNPVEDDHIRDFIILSPDVPTQKPLEQEAEPSLERTPTSARSRIDMSSAGRASGDLQTIRTGQLTPENSQDPQTYFPPSPSATHRVDEILDGRFPPTPLPSHINADMVEQAESISPLKQSNEIRASSRGRTSELPEILKPWFSSRRESRADSTADRDGVGFGFSQPLPEGQGRPIKSDAMFRSLNALLEFSAAAKPTVSQMTGSASNEGFRTPLSYYSSLFTLQRHLNGASQFNSSDAIALVTSPTSKPQRAKSGPKDWYTILHVTDTSIAPDTLEVHVFRPWQKILPVTDVGDVILLRDFLVKSRQQKCFLLSGDSSAWNVWRHNDSETPREERRGPPLEVGEMERSYASGLWKWWQSILKPPTMEGRSIDGGEGERQFQYATKVYYDTSPSGLGLNSQLQVEVPPA